MASVPQQELFQEEAGALKSSSEGPGMFATQEDVVFMLWCDEHDKYMTRPT